MQIIRGNYNAYAPFRMKKAGLKAPEGKKPRPAGQPVKERAPREASAPRQGARAGSR